MGPLAGASLGCVKVPEKRNKKSENDIEEKIEKGEKGVKN